MAGGCGGLSRMPRRLLTACSIAGSIIWHKNNPTKKLHAGGNLGRGMRRLEPQTPAVADRMYNNPT